MNVIIPFIAGAAIGLFGADVGLNAIAIVIGAVVIAGIVYDNLGQAINIALLTAVVTAIASGWVIGLVLIAIGAVVFYMHYGKEHHAKVSTSK